MSDLTRESRLIRGRYTITARDVFGQGRFDDSVAIFPEFIGGRALYSGGTRGAYFVPQYGLLRGNRPGGGAGAACPLSQGVPAATADITRIRKALAAQGVRYR